MVRENSASNYKPCRVDILSATLLISSLTSVCSVEVPHTNDSVDWALRALYTDNLLLVLAYHWPIAEPLQKLTTLISQLGD